MIIQQDNKILDNEFLIAMSEQKEREIYARIIALDINNNPVEQIEGKVTGGSINIDGNSTVRRTCNLTLVKDEVNINDYYWGIKTKFKLEIGLRNKLIGSFAANSKNKYPEIVWFSQGYYIITAFNTSLTTSGYTISISGKDKMCLLNGDLGGQLPSSIDFGSEETETFIMEKIILESQPQSSEELMNKAYFIEPIEEDLSTRIYINNPIFCFVQDQNGQYYKQGKYYTKKSESLNQNLKLYKVYKKATKPSDFFISTNNADENYIPNTYYYKNDFIALNNSNADNTEYYILDQSPGKVDGRIYYQLKEQPIYKQYVDIVKTKIPIEKIIREAVHTYADEPYQNIIINNLDIYGLEQLTYRGDSPLYAYYKVEDESFTQISHQAPSNLPNDFVFLFLNGLTFDGASTYIDSNNIKYKIMKIEFGQDAGYRLTDLIYPGDLICNAGESVTSVLDKIKTVLGEFEYFYNLEGKFVFQKKRNYVQTSWNQIVTNRDETYVLDANSTSKFSFNFKDNKLILAIQNNPVLNNLRNDYSVWGKRKTSSGAERSIHIRYAIDKKPVRYQTLKNEIYATDEYEGGQESNGATIIRRDWRELIYQMALDYFGAQGCSEEFPYGSCKSPDDFLIEVAERNSIYYPTGKTGYEQYYTDLQGFWRELYNPDYEPIPEFEEGHYEEKEDKYGRKQKVWVDSQIKDYIVDYYFNHFTGDLNSNEKLKKYYCTSNSANNSRKFWNINVFEHSEVLNFWLDFLDSDNTELTRFSIPQIGDRSKTISEASVNSAITYATIPDLIFYNDGEDNEKISKYSAEVNSGYQFIQFGEYEHLFNTSTKGISLKDKIDELIYQHSYCTENITLTTIPIYYLEPNTIISIQDQKTAIDGEYIINKITIPLTYNGTMSISAVKKPSRIL